MRFQEYIIEEIKDKKIYLDMDGVIVDFVESANNLFNVKSTNQWNSMKKSHWIKINKIGEKFWSDMSWTKDGKKLWDYLRKNYQKIQILSAHPLDKGESELGKRLWLRRNLGSSYAANAIICLGIDKQTYADINHILIDDSERNIRQWNNRGGIGIIHKNTNNTIKQLKEL